MTGPNETGTQAVSRPAVGVIAALALVLIVGAVMAFAGMAPEPADASGPTPTAQPTSTVAETATPVPSASPLPSPAPELTEAPIAADTLARVTVQDLTLRAEPSTTADVLGNLSFGADAFVNRGPVEAEGMLWYEVVPERHLFRSVECIGFACGPSIGWVIGVSQTNRASLEPTEIECPAAPGLDELQALTRLARLVCYSGQRLTLEGAVQSPCCGYVGPYRYTPDWLANPTPRIFFRDESQIVLRFRPSDGLVQPEYGDIVRVRGHFDDRAASRCGVEVDESMGDFDGDPITQVDPQTAAYVNLQCRMEFVIDSVQVIGKWSEGCGC